jgi:hypothetical protein
MLKVDDIITPDKLISLAHNCLSERRNSGIQLTPNCNIFFVKTDYINQFYQQYLPHINYEFVLITHDADNPVTEQYLPILQNRFLKKWFGMNCHVIHDKLQPVPIGIANECWPHGDKQALLDTANHEQKNKKGLVYSNFTKETNLNQRQDVALILKDLKNIFFENQKLPYKDYLNTLATYKFVISPPGNSIDCHRIWESIYIGTIPIVLKSVPMVYFKNCPILFIDKWEDLYEVDLEEKYYTIIQKSRIKSLFSFYREQILKTANE